LALYGGLIAAGITGLGMAFLRLTLQVRTIAERLMEASLLFIPPEVFGAGIQRFGFDAKRYALYASIVGMLVVLATIGTIALRRRWRTGTIVAVALGLWLFVMVVLMPLTDAGFFALGLIDGTKAAVGAHLAAALTYAAALELVRMLLDWKENRAIAAAGHGAAPEEALTPLKQLLTRRTALVLTGSALWAYAGTFFFAALGPRVRYPEVRLIDPQVPLPSGGIDAPDPHPYPVQTPPPGSRQLVRDKDGGLLASGRQRGELAPLITSNHDFYVVTKNAVSDPDLRLDQWRLVVDGDVDQPLEFTYETIRRLQPVEFTKTLECISNFVTNCGMVPFGCDLVSTARWKGARVADVLSIAGVRPGVVALATICADEFITALPIQAALDPETILVYEMNGEVLPREHGYPVRMLVPGRYGMKNAKWISALRPLRREFIDWYGQRNWSKDGVVKTMTRIDVPAFGAMLPAGEHEVAGIAYAGDRGVARVEYSSDGGQTWSDAQFIEAQPGRDAWVRWRGRFTLAPGATTTIIARATDGTGELQIEHFTLPEPDGCAGWHTTEVRALTS
jgi:DMSO/TMAO reductase YedYZ molybdopterin-dependent catalytic subunit